MDLVSKVQQTIVQKGLLMKGDTVIVAVSGGPDSTALLHVLHELSSHEGWQLVVAHMNHQLRGEDANRDALQVKRAADTLGWPCEISNVNVNAYMEEHGLSVQMAARQLRYDFLMQTAHKYGAQAIATGHHADDQAETIVMRMVRGTGLAGLSGIPIYRKEHNISIVRPLLHCYKDEIMEYCDTFALAYSTDQSNYSRDYWRNQVRLDIMPYLQQWNQKLPQALNQLSDIIGEENSYLEEETRRKFNDLVKNIGDQYIFSKMSFLKLPIALQRRLIKLILNYLCHVREANDYTKVELVREAITQRQTPSLRLDVSEQHELFMEYDHVCIGVKQAAPSQDYSYTVTTFPVCQPLHSIGRCITMEVMPVDGVDHDVHRQHHEAMFDLQHIMLPLHIRNRRPGDRMRIAGLNGSKKVKDIFIDEKIPPTLRAIQPIVVDGNGQLLWIPGMRRSDRAPVNTHTSQILHMKYEDHHHQNTK